MKKLILLAALAAGPASAGTVYIQFTSGTAQTGPAALPGGANATWQTFSVNPSDSDLPVYDIDDNPTGYTLSYVSTQNYTGGCCGGFGSAYDNLADGYLSDHGGTDTVTFNGLQPGQSFELYLYSERDCGCSSGTFSVNGSASQTTSTGLPDAFVLGENYLVFNGTANSGGQITIDYAPSPGSGEGEINGLQLVTTGAPEPGAAYLAFGGMALLFAVRFRRPAGLRS